MTRSAGLAWCLVAVAALRISLYALAFPFFNQVDEHQHVDSIVRYARGELPGASMATLDGRTARWALEFGSFEYLDPGPEPPLPYLMRPGESVESPLVREAYRVFTRVPNTEHDSPPVYYALGAVWMAAGEAAGLEGRALLYWLRLLNAAALAGLVGVSFVLLRRLAPDRPLVHLGVPLLLAMHPQDCLFGVTTDGVAIATGGLAFLALVHLSTVSGRASRRSYAVAGAAAAAAFLTKYTSVSLVIASLAWAAHQWSSWGPDERRRHAPDFVAWAVAAGVPVLLWFARNRWILGDWTGTGRKVEHLEWGSRPLVEWLDHPLFSVDGLSEFVGGLFARLWRGEIQWLGQEMAWPLMDAVYVAVSLLSALALLWAWRPAGSARVDLLAPVDALAAVAVGGAVVTLAILSLSFEFASWGTPTAEHPYFVHGRLISGVVWPLCWIVVRGLECAVGGARDGARERLAWLALLAFVAAATVSEWLINAPVFASAYNAFG